MNQKKGSSEKAQVKVSSVNFEGLERTVGCLARKAVVDHVLHATTSAELIAGLERAQKRLKSLDFYNEVTAHVQLEKVGNDVTSCGDGLNVTFVGKESDWIGFRFKPEMGLLGNPQVRAGIRFPNILGLAYKAELDFALGTAKENSRELRLIVPLSLQKDSTFKMALRRSSCSFNPISDEIVPRTTDVILSYKRRFGGCKNKNVIFCDSNKIKIIEDPTKECEIEFMHRFTRGLSPIWSTNDEGLAILNLVDHWTDKKVLRMSLSSDSRDKQFFPKRGTLVKYLVEYAGFCGDVNYIKVDGEVQQNQSLRFDMTCTKSLRFGWIAPGYDPTRSIGVSDKYFLGGPLSLRGFALNGVELDGDGRPLGGKYYWSTAAHLYVPVYYLRSMFPGIFANCRLHVFANAGNLADKLIGEKAPDGLFGRIRSAYGVGLSVALSSFAMLELNYVIPLVPSSYGKDNPVHGFQWGVGMNFL